MEEDFHFLGEAMLEFVHFYTLLQAGYNEGDK
jgi:hypothetical protein